MGVQTTKLANGITVATQKFDHVESVSVGVWIKAGTRNELEQEHGIAHMLEHMAFKGTISRSARDIAEAIENVGGDINAATSVETTSYFVRVLKGDLPLAVNILADILQNSRFDAGELEREKHVVLQELGAANDMPDDLVFDCFTETAFAGQPVGRPILGTRETINSFTPEMIRAYISREYCGERMVICATGAVDHDDFVRQVESAFATLPSTVEVTGLSRPAAYVGGECRVAKDLQDAQLVFGFEGRAYHMRDYYASQVLAMLLGGGMSSRLFQEVREKHGLCYSIYAFHWSFSDSGVFGIHAATERDDVPALTDLIIGELQKVPENLEQKELNRARAQFRASLMMSSESAPARAGQIARQVLLFGRPIDNEEFLARLDALTIERLEDLAYRMFASDAPTIAAVGPVEKLISREDFGSNLVSGLQSHVAAAVNS
ncbi:MAG: pitrilysin family protein [Pseudomonadota bacterium]